MLNNKHIRALFIKVMAISFFLTLLLAAPYISRKAPNLLKSLSGRGGSEQVTDTVAVESPSDNLSRDTLEGLMATRKASGKQVKPSFDNLPVELFSSNQPFALDFHKLPVDYLVPQAPEVTRKAGSMIKQLKAADMAAIKEQQQISSNSPESVATEPAITSGVAQESKQ